MKTLTVEIRLTTRPKHSLINITGRASSFALIIFFNISSKNRGLLTSTTFNNLAPFRTSLSSHLATMVRSLLLKLWNDRDNVLDLAKGNSCRRSVHEAM